MNLANSTYNNIINEIAKDIADPNMDDVAKYWKILSTKIEKFIDTAAKCTHKETSKSIKTIGISSGGKKKLIRVTECKHCDRVWYSDV